MSTWRATASGTPPSSTGGDRTEIRAPAPTNSLKNRSNSTSRTSSLALVHDFAGEVSPPARMPTTGLDHLGRLGCTVGVAVAGGGGDYHGVRVAVSAVFDHRGLPAGHFVDVVAALTQPAPIGHRGRSAVDAAMHMVQVANRRITVGVPAGPVPQGNQGGKRAVEAAAEPIPTDDRATGGAVNNRRHHRRPRLVWRISRAMLAGSGPWPAISAAVGVFGFSSASSGMSSCSSTDMGRSGLA